MPPADPVPAAPDVLAYRPAAAARALQVSGKTLWTWTKEGRVPHVVLNRATRKVKDKETGETHEQVILTIRYPVAMLTKWLEEKATAAAPPAEKAPATEATP